MKKSDFQSPEEVYGPLFYAVHKQGIFSDGKLFADAVAKMHPEIIVKTYLKEKDQSDFDLKRFIDQYFDIPQLINKEDIIERINLSIHVSNLWQELTRPKDKIKKKRTSKIPLPNPYIVPGGRFNEIYYWDSYFTMLGLKQTGNIEMIEHMVNNFKFLIDKFGFIPNGNRTYFLSRSQPPFYSLMIKLLLKSTSQNLIPQYLPSLVKEYNFWMNGLDKIERFNEPVNRIIKSENNRLLNRYHDDKDTPREEMFADDWKLKNFDSNLHHPIYRQLRAACESGWDFSSRWLGDGVNLDTIETSSILPVDLNCLLWHMEKLLSECNIRIGENETSINYGMIAHNRKKAIQNIFWDDELEFFCDYNWKENRSTGRLSLAGIFPLFFKLCTEEQANLCAEKIEKEFLRDGGVVTTPYNTGQQWDAPNGWAPLQYITVFGLLNYGFKTLAREIALRWIKLNEKIYQDTGKMLEKYNVENINLKGGGGEYPVQDGFGWTNGVYLALKAS